MTTHNRLEVTMPTLGPVLLGVTNVSTVSSATASKSALSFSRTNTSGSAWTIHVATYSVNGVILTDTYVGDN